MVPVSSPTRHSAIRVCRRCWDTDRPFCKTVLELTTLTMSVWPLVPGLSCSILTKTGFLRPGLAAALLCCSSCDAGVAIDGKLKINSTPKTLIRIRVYRSKISLLSLPILGFCVYFSSAVLCRMLESGFYIYRIFILSAFLFGFLWHFKFYTPMFTSILGT